MSISTQRTKLETTRFISGYSPKLKVGITFPENSKVTKQEFKEESDINTIMAQYQRTGDLPHINEVAPQYLDATGHDFRTHMEFVAGAKELFGEMSSDIRSRFDNNPAKFLDFTSDPLNRVEMARMGLLSLDAQKAILNPPSPPAPAPVQDAD